MERDDTRQYHLELARGDVGRYVFLPGDPGRCELIAQFFDEPHLVARNREYETWSGYLEGQKVSVTSTGIGGPSAAIALEELVASGADTFVRVGTAGSLQEGVLPGDIAVLTAAIRDEGTGVHYLPIEFPAVADHDITHALITAAREVGSRVHLGITQSKDSFYGQHDPQRMPVSQRLIERWSAWAQGGALCSEMETAALFLVGQVLRVRVAALVMVMGHPDQSPMSELEWEASRVENLLPTAIAGMREIMRRDNAGAA